MELVTSRDDGTLRGLVWVEDEYGVKMHRGALHCIHIEWND